ncbi:type II secretion system protein GspC [Idiomarina seosinensis]|uniref:Type II secretion system protein GspC n=1 Tax=Idiomarina seosinensis TaxID=281739 RepID=A0A432ZD07_9GAMM|nr:type II secretion system protein GspC [Idiomarina seosinensis]
MARELSKLQIRSVANSQLISIALNIATTVAWLLVAALAVQLIWWLITPVSNNSDTLELPAYHVSGRAENRVNLTQIKSHNIFGTAAEQRSRSRIESAPETQLNVRLIGVSASSNPLRSAAIIEQRGQQQTYIVGEELANSNVTIEDIYADRVILDNSGSLEVLKLEDIGESRPALSLKIGGSDSEAAELSPDNVSEAREKLTANPESMLDYVEISPIVVNGSLKGYRLRPGNQPELFNQAGFQSGDIAVSINGLDLTNMQQAMEAGQLLQNARQLTVTILRNDEQMELDIEL